VRRDRSIEWTVKNRSLGKVGEIDQDIVSEENVKGLRNLIYGTEELRKRGVEE
jgi:hypothetical protein